jgi:hypothetical protein
MHYSTIAGLLAMAASQVSAQQDPWWGKQSAPFYLVVKSHNSTLDGTYLGACHEGAAIEALCPYGKTPRPYEQFYFNTSIHDNSTLDDFKKQGLLTWNLPAGTENYSSAMRFSYDPSTNVAVPSLMPGSYPSNIVGWSNHSSLIIGSGQDDRKPLPNYDDKSLSRWYICTTRITWYVYQTLAWTMGEAKPQNPTCQKVTVHRQMV